MSEFASEMAGRVARTTESLEAALAADDEYLAAVLYGELESLARVAGEHDVEVPGLADALARHGEASELHLPEQGTVIDLGGAHESRDEAQRIA